MSHLSVTSEFEADDFGPHEVVEATVQLAPAFAEGATEAHAMLLTLMVTEEFFELPTEDDAGFLALYADSVREVAVWEGG